MRISLVIAIAFLTAQGRGLGAMTLLFREMFVSTGEVTAQSPGAFSSVTGTLYQRAGGPRLAGKAAASVDLRNAKAFGCYNLPNPASPRFFAGAWVFVKSLSGSGTSLISIRGLDGRVGPSIANVNGTLRTQIPGLLSTPCPVNPTNQWIYVAVAVRESSSTTADVRFYYRLPGGTMETWAGTTSATTGIASPYQIWFGSDNSAAWQGRLGAPSVYTFEADDFSDVVYPSDLLDPSRGLTWYCNPQTGSDSNDGSTRETAWATAAKLNEEGLHSGLFSADSHAQGDTLEIDTSGAELDLFGGSLVISTRGLNVKAAPSQSWIRIKSYRTLASGGWSPTGVANVYSSDDTQPYIVAWEDDKFMAHPVGATFASVSAALSANPGSFWTDGSKLYLHPFGSTDPRTDGKRYERSYLLARGAAVVVAAPDTSVRDIYVGKTCLAEKSNNDAIGNYCVGTENDTGASEFKHCYLYYGSKHNLGLVGGKAGDSVVIDGVQAEQGSPYTWAGGQTVFVSFNGGESHLGIVHSYRNCITHANTGLVGSKDGTMTSGYPVFYSHNNGGQDQFAKIEFIDCDFGEGSLQGGAMEAVDITGTHCGYVIMDTDVSLSRSFIKGTTPNGADRHLKARNCIYAPSNTLSKNPFAGTVDIQFCTFDASGVTSILGGVPDSALFSAAGPLNFVFRNNAVILPAGSVGANVFSNFHSSDNLDINANVYQLRGSVLSYRYDANGVVGNKSLAQWQDLGFEQGSSDWTDLKLISHVPQPGSPLIGTASNGGPGEDYSGNQFLVRNDAGAYEVMRTFLHWQVENFPGADLQNAAFGPLGLTGNDGVSNLLKYALSLGVQSSGFDAFPRPETELANGGQTAFLTLTYNRPRDVADISYTIEESVDLVSWQPSESVEEMVMASDSHSETIRAKVPAGGAARKFLRLKVNLR